MFFLSYHILHITNCTCMWTWTSYVCRIEVYMHTCWSSGPCTQLWQPGAVCFVKLRTAVVAVCFQLKSLKCRHENTIYKSKIPAWHLEKLLPSIINTNQEGFVTGRNSCNKMRKLLNVIQLSCQHKLVGMVISLNAAKTFNRSQKAFSSFDFSHFWARRHIQYLGEVNTL